MISFLFWDIPTHSALQGPGCLGAVRRGWEGHEKGEGIWTWLPPTSSGPWSHPYRKPIQKEHILYVLKGSEAEMKSVALGMGVTRKCGNLLILALARRRRHPLFRPGVFI